MLWPLPSPLIYSGERRSIPPGKFLPFCFVQCRESCQKSKTTLSPNAFIAFVTSREFVSHALQCVLPHHAFRWSPGFFLHLCFLQLLSLQGGNWKRGCLVAPCLSLAAAAPNINVSIACLQQESLIHMSSQNILPCSSDNRGFVVEQSESLFI